MRHYTLSKGEPRRLRDHFVRGASRRAGLEDRFRLRIILPAAGFEVQGDSGYRNHAALFQLCVMY